MTLVNENIPGGPGSGEEASDFGDWRGGSVAGDSVDLEQEHVRVRSGGGEGTDAVVGWGRGADDAGVRSGEGVRRRRHMGAYLVVPDGRASTVAG